ncbi:MAG: 50S ribosomal protein L22 [Candidatus Magasanikbacteria bacterium RIFOXYC2_FULL_42_28]|uniref:Large ribosomal subunit protein uL22 n=1 Tax=Candidatus Magasanikbacteria bacterium RIFOXYC2_FULL_42_28 TaxID=1798704 RepID=A0A1F6NU90_9BACT|nr:MAG: 50S ribosomal protein L22 [Candidatus Magasanikbacteria bacterium RIFOXYC2_FULL_42_28]
MSQEIVAKLRYFRQGPRKMRLVVDMIRGRNVARALQILELTNKKSARAILKLLQSAVANAKHNFSLNEDNLRISKITVDGGPVLKRWMPKAHGRATPIRERTSHINLYLSEFVKKEKINKKKVKEIKVKK